MRKVPVDISMLCVALESHGESKWYLDLDTGDVLPLFDDLELEEKIENDPDRFLLITAYPPRDDFRFMEDFVARLPSGEAKRDLERVLRRSKPFRNFREALRDWPEVRKEWFTLREQRAEQLAKEWLADHDIDPVSRAPEQL